MRRRSGRCSAGSDRKPVFAFFRIPKLPTLDVSGLLHANPDQAFTLVAESKGEACALAGYTRDPHGPERAEVAFVTSDALQGRGIGTRMLEALADIARAHRIRRFDAYVLTSNNRMMGVFVDSGFASRSAGRGGRLPRRPGSWTAPRNSRRALPRNPKRPPQHRCRRFWHRGRSPSSVPAASAARLDRRFCTTSSAQASRDACPSFTRGPSRLTACRRSGASTRFPATSTSP